MKTSTKKSAPSQTNPIATYNAIVDQVQDMAVDVEKFMSGTNAAGGRLRKGAMNIKKLCGAFRTEIQEVRNSRKQ